MTTAAKPLPPHGSTARAYGSRGYRDACKCGPCRKARNRHNKRIRVNRQLGRSPFINPDAAQAHLHDLHTTMSWPSLVAATGIELSNLVLIYGGRRTKIRHETHAKIMAVRAPAQGDRGQYLDATRSMRQLQALAAIGHSYTVLAGAAHTARNRILSIANGRQPTIRRALAERVEAVYQQLAVTPAPVDKHSNRTRNVARSKGWRDPQWWEDYGRIDDPAFDPASADAELGFLERAALRREEIIHLAWHGDTPDQIHARLDDEVSISTVRQVIQEWRSGQKRDRKQVAA